jgi:glycosyltransferase involved in cell wall biosynthesis
MMNQPKNNLRVALVVPHIFLHRDILSHVIFSPGTLALDLARELTLQNVDITLFSPGPIDTLLPTVHSDMSYFESELEGRGDTYIDLLKKHPFTFVSLSRQVQAELIAKAYAAANNDEYDIVHIYTNEEDIALPFAKLCRKPVVFTHHDPFNFMVKYKNVFPKYPELSWLSISLAQREGMPAHTNWVGNVYHGLDPKNFTSFVATSNSHYIAYLGRIIEPKGVHLAIDAVNLYNETADVPLTLKIAGKHYADAEKDTYWQEKIVPKLGKNIEYVGFIKDIKEKNEFLGKARALVIPSTFNEPFGMVMIEALASGTPIIGLNSGAIPEVITDKTGILIEKSESETDTINLLACAFDEIGGIDRQACRDDFEARFTLKKMCEGHILVYKKLIQSQDQS